jgi:protein-disulfide isomerase
MEDKNATLKKYVMIIGGILLFGLLVFGLEHLASQDETSVSTSMQATDADTKVQGNKDTAVTLLEYSDFQCPACATYEPLVQKLHEEFPDTLKIVYRYFPLTTIHKNAMISAKAAEAAHRQGKFWGMHDQLFGHQSDWAQLSDPNEKFLEYATTAGLNIDQFNTDMKDSSIGDAVKSDQKMGNAVNIPGTPTFFLNGTKLAGPQNYEEFKKLVEDELAKSTK